MIIGPNSTSPGVLVTKIEARSAPVGLMQMDHSVHPAPWSLWHGLFRKAAPKLKESFRSGYQRPPNYKDLVCLDFFYMRADRIQALLEYGYLLVSKLDALTKHQDETPRPNRREQTFSGRNELKRCVDRVAHMSMVVGVGPRWA